MSDIDDLRRIYGLVETEVPDWEIVDKVNHIIAKEYRIESENLKINKGRIVHKIWLTANVPAKVVKVEFNKRLDHDVEFGTFNKLNDSNFKSPGSWLVRKGFVVRSRKENGYWVQYALSTDGPDNLTRSEMMEYLDIAEMDYDPNLIDDLNPVTVE